ncbi:hypothetical protein [Rhodoferax saidenbachensis]|uniref:Uncharacterized protein n=1 Tax=Rhodoferax saidenbachensis TaxID=1484693 RepID=A0A1P8KBL6_9BURK|nr:hypothetical protein [Rhodoferax saidenbachensis]APW43412.1 hypothetical protein RS694_13315 [Rhodoferax saidenbachensis]
MEEAASHIRFVMGGDVNNAAGRLFSRAIPRVAGEIGLGIQSWASAPAEDTVKLQVGAMEARRVFISSSKGR